MGLMAELQEITKDEAVNIIAGVPVIAEKIDVLSILYGFADMEALGDVTDRVGLSEAFQDVVNRASELGHLFESRAMIDIG